MDSVSATTAPSALQMTRLRVPQTAQMSVQQSVVPKGPLSALLMTGLKAGQTASVTPDGAATASATVTDAVAAPGPAPAPEAETVVSCLGTANAADVVTGTASAAAPVLSLRVATTPSPRQLRALVLRHRRDCYFHCHC